jgi:inositol transporter-like SP family MFS transporter
MLAFGMSAAFSGESIYKVWSQELVPTLLRSTSQGITLAFARLLAAAFGVITPAFATAAPQLMFAVLAGCVIISALIGLLIVPRLMKAEELGPETSMVMTEGAT